MQWNTLPRKLQRELFDNASSMGDMAVTEELRNRIARFLHKHKDDLPHGDLPLHSDTPQWLGQMGRLIRPPRWNIRR